MPASPQDFALWSRMTGNPYPQSVAERVALAPQVYEFSKNIGKQNGPMGGVRGAIDTLGKIALAAGAVAGAGYLASKYGGGNPPPPPSSGGAVALPLDTEPGVYPPEARYTPDVTSPTARASGDITHKTTAQNFNEEVIGTQTAASQAARGLSPQKPTQVSSESKPATQSEVIASRQTFAPGTEADMIGEDAVQKAIAFRNSKAYGVMQSQYPGLRDTDTEMLGGSETVSAPPVSSANVVQPVAYPAAVAQGASQMSQPKIAPAVGPSPEEIRDLDKTLLLAHAATTNRTQRESMRNEMLAKKYGGQAESKPEYVGTGETVTTATQPPAPKEFLHSAVQGVKQRAHLSKYGYDPQQDQAPGMEQVGPAHADLMAEQMQHELGRKAEREAMYKRISPSPTADLSYLAKEGPGKFFNPASYVMS
jgi:hypothetical protein